ncbi:MAG TPA: serine/threonine-protein kinase, partial [Acidobacteriota bacterium]|nr:serine/threonine-protein kinase [Acidobacteriota bacterium]
MPLSTGLSIGPYEILEPLGEGGMGEVYRAKDNRLGREVAVKILPARLTGNPEALARFDRETRALAAISHPNILTIYDCGTAEDQSYSVMELLEGETLRERLKQTSIPLQKVLDIAIDVSEGLSAAHARGIIHRDIKPENIFLTADGRTKILDFGVARIENAVSVGELTSFPTTTETAAGMILGTVGYMSPEQVRGAEID